MLTHTFVILTILFFQCNSYFNNFVCFCSVVFQNSGVASYTKRWVLVYIYLNKVQICNFFTTVLTSELDILTISFLECNNYISLCCLRKCVRHVKECTLAYLDCWLHLLLQAPYAVSEYIHRMENVMLSSYIPCCRAISHFPTGIGSLALPC